jgi:uncharacterized membrane protein
MTGIFLRSCVSNIGYLMKLSVIAYILLAIVFFGVGVAHLVSVGGFVQFLPVWFPLPWATVVFTGVLEIAVAIGLCIPGTRAVAGKAVFILLLLYLPLHVIDVLREQPVIGPKVVAIIRLPVQGVMLYLAWVVGWKGQS